MREDRVTITNVRFRNYKALSDFSVRLQGMNILVGPNNCGKSTIIGAFRALDTALRRTRNRALEPVPDLGGRETIGYVIPDESLPISTENVHTDYEETDAIVSFRLSNGNELQLYFPIGGGCFLLPKSAKRLVRTASGFRTEFPITLAVVPVLGPVEHREELVQAETVQRNLTTHRASRNFRNYWHHFPDDFEHFAMLIADTWPGMEVQPPERAPSAPNQLLMFCLENRMTRELYWSGFGFQVWCQLLTHVIRSQNATLFIVDEPDIYLHPDAQRQLVSILRESESDVLIATHSAEIIGEADPAEIAVIDKQRRSAQRLRNVAGVQEILDAIGSNQNLTLTRLARNRKVLFVEGERDFTIMADFARKLGLNGLASGVTLTPIEAGGFSSWERIKALGWGLRKTIGQSIKIAAAFDRDYRCQEEVDKILAELGEHVSIVQVHSRKEIENYLLTPGPLARATRSVIRERNVRAQINMELPESVEPILDEITKPMKIEVQSQYLAARAQHLKHSGQNLTTINKQTLEWFESGWNSIESRLGLVPGKDVLAAFRRRMQTEYGVTLTDHRIVSAFREDEIAPDLRALLVTLDSFSREQ